MRTPRTLRLDPVSSRSRRNEEIDYDKKFETIKGKAGILNFGLREYRGLSYDQLTEVRPLGEGTCGRVTHCKFEGHSIAIKRMRRTDNVHGSKRVFTDLDVVTKCNSPYIIKGIGYFISSEHIDICMEMMVTCFEKVLMRYGKGLPEEVLGKISYCVVSALDYLKEEHKLMHRDIKPPNILMDVHGHVKLCDFGISGQLIDSKALTTSQGSYAYLAPERITTDIENTRLYDVRADVWSLGITIVQLARGCFPYKNYGTTFELLTKIYEEPAPVLVAAEGFSEPLCDFVRDCLRKEMSERPKYKKLLAKTFIVNARESNYDVALWYRRHCMDKPLHPLSEKMVSMS